MSVTETDLAILELTNHVLKYKVELLDNEFDVIDEIATDASNVTFNIDSSSDVRRTATMKLVIEDETWVTENFEIGWLNKYVRFSIGILYNGDFVYYVLGTMLLSSDSFLYDATNSELTLTLVDLMAYATSQRGSQIGYYTVIPYESNVKNALLAVIARYMPVVMKFGDVEEFPDVVPYDLEFEAGAYPYDLMSGLLELFPWYEQYYDCDGMYHAKKIPMAISEDVVLGPEQLDSLIISEERNFDFAGIKNTTEIWGRELKADYTPSICTLTGDTYYLQFLTELEAVESQANFAIIPDRDSPSSPKLSLTITNSDGSTTQRVYDIVDSNGDELESGAMIAGNTYVLTVTYLPTDNDYVIKFFLQGEQIIHVIVREMNEAPTDQQIADDMSLNGCNYIEYIINPDSPYAVDRLDENDSPFEIRHGEIRQVLKDGDYSKIYTTSLALQRAEYENYLKTRQNTAVKLKTILIPFLDVNQKISYTSPKSGEVRQYMIKAINMNVSDFTMEMDLTRFYGYYPWLNE